MTNFCHAKDIINTLNNIMLYQPLSNTLMKRYVCQCMINDRNSTTVGGPAGTVQGVSALDVCCLHSASDTNSNFNNNTYDRNGMVDVGYGVDGVEMVVYQYQEGTNVLTVGDWKLTFSSVPVKNIA